MQLVYLNTAETVKSRSMKRMVKKFNFRKIQLPKKGLNGWAPFVYVQINIYIASSSKCASVGSPFPSLFPSTEILTGECVQHDNPVRSKSHVFWLILSGYQY